MPKVDKSRIGPALGLSLLVALAITGTIWPEPLKQPQQERQVTGVVAEPKSASEKSEEIIAFYTEALAWFTAVLAIGTIGLLVFSYRQSKDTQKSIELASKEFTSTHRPRIAIRDVYAVPSEGNPIVISYSLVNSGESDAWIIESALEIEFPKTAGLMLIPDSNKHMNIPGAIGVLKAGELRTFEHRSRDLKWNAADMSHSHHDIDVSVRPELGNLLDRGLFFSGRLVYVDAAKTRRQVVFRHRYHKGKQRFYPFGDAELEYAD